MALPTAVNVVVDSLLVAFVLELLSGATAVVDVFEVPGVATMADVSSVPEDAALVDVFEVLG